MESSVYAGYPQPEYRWMKDGVFQTDFSSEPVYKIQSIRREDAGVYQCVARNAVGSIFSEQVQVLVACEFDTFLLPLHPFLLGFLSSSGNSREREREKERKKKHSTDELLFFPTRHEPV